MGISSHSLHDPVCFEQFLSISADIARGRSVCTCTGVSKLLVGSPLQLSRFQSISKCDVSLKPTSIVKFLLPANVAQFHLRDSKNESSGHTLSVAALTRRSSIVGTLWVVAIVGGNGRSVDAVNNKRQVFRAVMIATRQCSQNTTSSCHQLP